jgi:hypothetical protein
MDKSSIIALAGSWNLNLPVYIRNESNPNECPEKFFSIN